MPFMNQSWINRSEVEEFKKEIECLIDAFKKVSDWMKDKTTSQKARHHKPNVVREVSENIAVTTIPAATQPLENSKYKRVSRCTISCRDVCAHSPFRI